MGCEYLQAVLFLTAVKWGRYGEVMGHMAREPLEWVSDLEVKNQWQFHTRMPFSRRPTASLFEKLYGRCAPDFTHPAKMLYVGVVDMHYFDNHLGPTTLILKLNLDMEVNLLAC